MHHLGKRQQLARKRRRIFAGGIALIGLAAGATLLAGRLMPDAVEPAPSEVALLLPERTGGSGPASSEPSVKQQTATNWNPLESSNADSTATVDIADSRAETKDETWASSVVAPGDNLSLVFSRLKLSKSDLHYMVADNPHAKHLKRVKPGQSIRFRNDGPKVLELMLEIDPLTTLHVTRDGDRFRSELNIVEPDIRVARASAEISTSLFVDGQKAGLSDALIMRLTDIFGWDIDFALDIRESDRFSLIYEEIYKQGEFIKQDRILAAEFINRGKRLKAVLFTDDSGHSAYYSESGEAMKKAFLRTPVNFTRISSRFNLRRKHPVLNTIRAHRGVDYAAPMGTPVRATANGKIISAGTNGGYGRVVEIQHGETYRTVYAHLSRFARGIKRRSSVKQGQIVGYVGKSGLATGPHLHYEFRVNGVHRNPLTVALPKAEPIARSLLAQFKSHAAPYLEQLAVLSDGDLPVKDRYLAKLDVDTTGD